MSDSQTLAAPVAALLDQWAAGMAQVLESMAGQKAAVRWQPGAPPPTEPELLWWEQPLQIAPEMTVWTVAPRTTWEYAGTATLKAAGLETVEIAEARNTWIELLGQSLSVLARAVGAVLGREVSCGVGDERAPAAVPESGASVSMDFGQDGSRVLWIGISPKLSAVLSMPPPARKPEPDSAAPQDNPGPAQSPAAAGPPPTMDLLLEVELPVSISFGKTELPMKDVLKLTTGSIVELNRGVNEPVEVLVNHCLIARGEVVVVEGNYGVRIQQIASRQDRLRTLR